MKVPAARKGKGGDRRIVIGHLSPLTSPLFMIIPFLIDEIRFRGWTFFVTELVRLFITIFHQGYYTQWIAVEFLVLHLIVYTPAVVSAILWAEAHSPSRGWFFVYNLVVGYALVSASICVPYIILSFLIVQGSSLSGVIFLCVSVVVPSLVSSALHLLWKFVVGKLRGICKSPHTPNPQK